MKTNDSVTMLCPHCGAELNPDATFCRHCGSDRNTGWKDGAEFADVELPDYEEIIENEFGIDSMGKKKSKTNPFVVVAAVIVAAAFICAMVIH